MRPQPVRGLFVTGTDTGVGKTRVAVALAGLLRARGMVVQPRKPVESGCRRVAGRLIPADALSLRAAAGLDLPLETICPYPLESACSAERAAMLAGLSLHLDDLVRGCRHRVAAGDFLLVEGAGGFYSPLAAGVLNADLATALGLPVLLVTADRLGAIGHTLLTAEAVERRGLVLAGVVLNRVQPSGDPDLDNVSDLGRWLGRSPIVTEYAGSVETSAEWQAFRRALGAFAASL